MGLDIYVHRLVLPDEDMKDKVLTEEEIRERHPDVSIRSFEPDDKIPEELPKGYLFKAKFKYVSFPKLFEKHSTPERSLKWEDGWRDAGGGTGPVRDEDAVPGCNWYLFFIRDVKNENGENDFEHVCLPGDDKGVEGCLDEFERQCFMYDNEELGYMRRGENDLFYPDMEAGKPNWVFTKKTLDEYAEKYFDEEGDPRYGNSRAYFNQHIQTPFGNGEGKLVWFWW